MDVIEVSCQPSTINTHGELFPGGYIDLTGKVIEAECEFFICGDRAYTSRPGFKRQKFYPDCALDVYEVGGMALMRRKIMEPVLKDGLPI